MRLVARRVRQARGLLVAAATATLLATVVLTAVVLYGGQVIDAGSRSAVAAAPGAERTVLVSGSVTGPDALRDLDRTVENAARDAFTGTAPVTTARAGYASGQQLPSRLGDARPGADGLTLASVVFLDDLADHADLVSGTWPEPDAGADAGPRAKRNPIRTALAEPVARVLGVRVGDRIPLTNRRDDERRTAQVSGIWQPRNRADPYWLLVPELSTGSMPGTATYGPLVIGRGDFERHFADLATVSWLVAPDLSGVRAQHLTRVRAAADRFTTELREHAGDRLSATTRIGELTTRLDRSAVVARSATLVPALLLTVIAGYALVLVAGLLARRRQTEDALIRARGAGSRQLAALAGAEAALVVGPALLLGAPAAVGVLLLAGQLPPVTGLGLRLDPALTGTAWLTAAATATGCGVALVLPSLRRNRTYQADQQARSRAVLSGTVQRAGIDIALVVFAVLAWGQLRQYGSPLLGLDVDPVLVAAPTLGVLAATVLALRPLPWVTLAGQWLASRRNSFPTLLGAWQAGRRPHAGTVLLLSLAVAVATLAICLEHTWQRSLVDQASHQAGADLRLVEQDAASQNRSAEIEKVPGVKRVLPTVTTATTIGTGATSTVLMLDSEHAFDVVRPREDLATRADIRNLATARQPGLAVPLPSGAATLSAELTVTATGPGDRIGPVETRLDVRDRYGVVHPVPLGKVAVNRGPTRLTVTLPHAATELYGFSVGTTLARFTNSVLTWTVRDLATATGSGRRTALDLPQTWRLDHHSAERPVTMANPTVRIDGDRLTVTHQVRVDPRWETWLYLPQSFRFDLLRPVRMDKPLSALVTPQVLADIGGRTGSRFTLPLSGGDVTAQVAGVIKAVPGVDSTRALVVDLDAATTRTYLLSGATPRPTEWRITTDRARHHLAVRRLSGISRTDLVDRHAVIREPLGSGARLTLFPAALAAALLAALGAAVDLRATARDRSPELAVLHTLGSGPTTLVRALVTEQGLLAGLGVLTGLATGALVAWTMAPLVVLAPDATRPVPDPELVVDPVTVGVPVLGLLLVVLTLTATVTAGVRQNLTVLVLGQDR